MLSGLLLAASLASCSLFAGDPSRVASASADTLATSSAAAVPAGFYRVNPGDTPISVARAFGREPSSISQWNHLSPDGGLLVGQVLRVAPPRDADGLPASGTEPNPPTDSHALVANSPNAPHASKARLAWPVGGPAVAPFVPGSTNGIVMRGRAGEPVRAAAGGRVVYAGSRIPAYGELIIIKHDAHLSTAYGNNRALLVKEGSAVKQGEAIADMGTDDNGQASLRFEVRVDGKPVDPLKYLPTRR